MTPTKAIACPADLTLQVRRENFSVLEAALIRWSDTLLAAGDRRDERRRLAGLDERGRADLGWPVLPD